MVAEARLFKRHGGGCLVDQTSIGLARDPVGLQQVSREAGVHVVMATSYYTHEYHNEEVKADSTFKGPACGDEPRSHTAQPLSDYRSPPPRRPVAHASPLDPAASGLASPLSRPALHRARSAPPRGRFGGAGLPMDPGPTPLASASQQPALQRWRTRGDRRELRLGRAAIPVPMREDARDHFRLFDARDHA